MKTIKYSKLLLKTAILTSIGYSCSAQTSDTTVVNFSDVHQVIDGFGASSAGGAPEIDVTMTDAQADMFFSPIKGIGLSLERNQITPSGTTYETSIMKQAIAQGAKVWSTPWSPPADWKSNDDSLEGGYLLPQYYPNYAGQFARYVQAMKDSGINLYAVSIQNEPNGAATWESCTYTNAQMHAFIPYLYDSLQSRGLGATKIMAAEESSWNFDTITEIMNDPVTDSMLGICAAHNYGGAIAPFNTNGKPLWETEVSTLTPFDSSISNAFIWANRIHQFMTVANANAWHYWWLINHWTDNEGLTNNNGKPAKRMYVLGNFSKFIRPGYYRVGTSGSPGGVKVSAYKDSATRAFVIVAINNNDFKTTFTATLNGLSAPNVTPWITCDSLDLATQSVVTVNGSSFTYTLPDSSVTTFVYSGVTTGINMVKTISNNISVYPNPGSGMFNINVHLSFPQDLTIAVYTIMGAKVYETTYKQNSESVLKINLSDKSNGVYIVNVITPDKSIYKKIILQR